MEILASGVLVGATMVVHGCGMYCVARASKHGLPTGRAPRPTVHIGLAVSVLIALALTTHLFDIVLWAVTFQAMDLVTPAHRAFHFAALTFTTLGAPTSLPEPWLLLEAACAIAGTFTFTWTTAVMFQILNRVFEWNK